MIVLVPHILVVDDEKNFAKMVGEVLRAAGYEVTICHNGPDALTELQEQDFALILADYKMPQMDGADFLRRARAMLPDLPVIMISGFMKTPELMEVANIGVTLVLEKPIQVPALIQAVRRFVEPPIPEGETQEVDAAGDSEGGSGESINYPKPLRFLRDTCPVAQGWIELFWEAHQSERHIPIVYAPGSCWNAAVREAALWGDGSPQNTFRVVAMHENVSSAITRLGEALQDEQHPPSIIAVELGAGMQVWVEAWVKALPPVLQNHPDLRCLYGGHQPEDVALPSSLALQATPLVIPPLKDRLGDLALQTVQFLKFHGGGKEQRFSQRAIRLLLHYDWPGNEDELFAVIRRLGVMGSGGSIQAPELIEGLERAHAVIDHRLADHDLNWFLQERLEAVALRQSES